MISISGKVSKFQLQLLLLLALFLYTIQAHVAMIDPPPRKSKYNPWVPQEAIDYNMNAPLGAYPCKGYPADRAVRTYKAGTNINVKLDGGATHNGGHCQFAVSYNGGADFVVLKTELNECLRNKGNEYQVPIPETAPSSDRVVFSWTWINRTGNREYYMNCADIIIEGSPQGYITGPELLVVNVNGQPTVGEFNGDTQYRGLDMFDRRRMITVTGSSEVKSADSWNSIQPKLEARNIIPGAQLTNPNPIVRQS